MNPLSFDVEYRGALFENPTPPLDRAADAMEHSVAVRGAEIVRDRVKGAVSTNATGHYASEIVAARRGEYSVITDSGVIYGPWVEGVAARNQISRFKGYRAFRNSVDEIERQADVATAGDQRQLVRELEK